MRLFNAITSVATLVLAFAAVGCASPHAESSSPRVEVAADAELPPAAAAAGRLVAEFDVQAGELPEGLVFTSERALVGFAPTSRVAQVNLETGVLTAYGELPAPVPNQGFMTGLAAAPGGQIYAGLASFVPEVQAGIYRIPNRGGPGELFAKDAALAFPNALTFDGQSALWVTDSGSGSVFRIDTEGNVLRWATGPELTGDKEACDAAGPGFPIGANGLVVEDDAVYVVNMDQATLVKIPRNAQGNAEAPEILAGPDCDTLGGADGLVRALDGGFLVAVNRQNKLVHVNAEGSVKTVLRGAPLDFPATLAYSDNTLYVTNFALNNASQGKDAAPGLVRVGE
jgi:sugar lactone lactonase YvrE